MLFAPIQNVNAFFTDRTGFQASGEPRLPTDRFGLYYKWDDPFPQDVLGTVPKLIDFVRSMQLKFNRDQELEADACSTVWLKDIGVDPIAAWDAYRATVGANADNPASYSASHPTTPEREARFKRKAAGHPMPAGQGSGKRQEVPPVKR